MLNDLIARLKQDPFTPLSSLGIDPYWFEINRAAIIAGLSTNKYWSNTLYPLIKSGHLGSIIEDQYVYPHRIGLFPGLSCMFYCGFCGRNKNAAYERASVDRGISIYKQVMSDAPKDGDHWRDRFRISGGQEPLTNPRIGELVSHGRSLGLNMGIYTNGYMLTPSYLKKQSGLFDLDYIRISMYGYDASSYDQITKREGAWQVIRQNLIAWSQMAETKSIKLGVNWIILPGKINDYLGLLQTLDELQDEMRRPIDFLTVREDFSQDIVHVSNEERKQLISMFERSDSYMRERMPQTKIDYGYALDPLRRGEIVGPLRMARHDQLEGKGLPQASVQIDILGNIYAYHETAFLDRPGSSKFIIGNAEQGVKDVVSSHLANPSRFSYLPSDTEMLDAFDHAVSLAVWAARQDISSGFNSTLWQG